MVKIGSTGTKKPFTFILTDMAEQTDKKLFTVPEFPVTNGNNKNDVLKDGLNYRRMKRSR